MLNRKNVNFAGDVKHNSIPDIDEEQKKQKSHFNNGYIMHVIRRTVWSTSISIGFYLNKFPGLTERRHKRLSLRKGNPFRLSASSV